MPARPLCVLGMSPSELPRLPAHVQIHWRGAQFQFGRRSFDSGSYPLRHAFFGRFESLERFLAPTFRLAFRFRRQTLGWLSWEKDLAPAANQGISTSIMLAT